MNQNKLPVLISANEIQNRVRELGEEITKKHQNNEIIAICILKGGVVFFSDMIRHIDLPVRCEFMSLSSYGDSHTSSGEVKLDMDIKYPIQNKHVIVFEDIVDSGLTLQYVLSLLKLRNPKSLELCTLLSKPSRRKTPVQIDYLGFEIEDRFVVGYGLDDAGLSRNLPYVGWIDTKDDA